VRLRHASLIGLLVVVLAGVTTAPVAASVRSQEQPDRCKERPGSQRRPCVGPVTDESGGGGDALTIGLSVVVGLAIAGAAFLLVRRQLATRTTPREPR
jgi:hypothetical protein